MIYVLFVALRHSLPAIDRQEPLRENRPSFGGVETVAYFLHILVKMHHLHASPVGV
jgi:hypothetical protein